MDPFLLLFKIRIFPKNVLQRNLKKPIPINLLQIIEKLWPVFLGFSIIYVVNKFYTLITVNQPTS
jgi:hypothetical protein